MKQLKPGTYYSLGGTYSDLFSKILASSHTLIGGTTGSGKSCLLDGVLYAMMCKNPVSYQCVLIDPKRVDLRKYKDIPYCIGYASEPEEILTLLKECIALMECRYSIMASSNQSTYNGATVYIIIDELADLIVTSGKIVKPILHRLTALGRAAKIHVIMATQSPSRRIIGSDITLNVNDRIALHCQSSIESRQIIGMDGAEDLPLYGECYYKTPTEMFHYKVPLYTREIQTQLNHWHSKECFKSRFQIILAKVLHLG